MKEDCESKVANLLATMQEVKCPETKIDLLSKAVVELQKQIDELMVIVGRMEPKS